MIIPFPLQAILSDLFQVQTRSLLPENLSNQLKNFLKAFKEASTLTEAYSPFTEILNILRQITSYPSVSSLQLNRNIQAYLTQMEVTSDFIGKAKNQGSSLEGGLIAKLVTCGHLLLAQLDAEEGITRDFIEGLNVTLKLFQIPAVIPPTSADEAFDYQDSETEDLFEEAGQIKTLSTPSHHNGSWSENLLGLLKSTASTLATLAVQTTTELAEAAIQVAISEETQAAVADAVGTGLKAAQQATATVVETAQWTVEKIQDLSEATDKRYLALHKDSALPPEIHANYLCALSGLGWAIYHEAAVTQKKFVERGLFAISDPSGRLFAFCDDYAHAVTGSQDEELSFTGGNFCAYGRKPQETITLPLGSVTMPLSSHFREEEAPYQLGLDLRLKATKEAFPLFPAGMRHLLVGQFSVNSTHQNHCFFKFEPCGLGSGKDIVHHWANGLKAALDNNPPNTYREKDIPLKAHAAFDEFLSHVPDITPEAIKNQCSTIAQMTTYVLDIKHCVEINEEESFNELVPSTITVEKKVVDSSFYQKAFFNTLNSLSLTHPELRHGNEVILQGLLNNTKPKAKIIYRTPVLSLSLPSSGLSVPPPTPNNHQQTLLPLPSRPPQATVGPNTSSAPLNPQPPAPQPQMPPPAPQPQMHQPNGSDATGSKDSVDPLRTDEQQPTTAIDDTPSPNQVSSVSQPLSDNLIVEHLKKSPLYQDGRNRKLRLGLYAFGAAVTLTFTLAFTLQALKVSDVLFDALTVAPWQVGILGPLGAILLAVGFLFLVHAFHTNNEQKAKGRPVYERPYNQVLLGGTLLTLGLLVILQNEAILNLAFSSSPAAAAFTGALALGFLFMLAIQAVAHHKGSRIDQNFVRATVKQANNTLDLTTEEKQALLNPANLLAFTLMEKTLPLVFKASEGSYPKKPIDHNTVYGPGLAFVSTKPRVSG